jgi:hypothetical protein
MSPKRHWLLVTALLFAMCRSRSGAASLGEVPVVAPFDAMGLPIGNGVVWSCNGARIKIVYDGGSKPDLGDAYGRAVRDHGWLRAQPAAMSGSEWVERYQRAGGAETLTLEVHDADFKGKVPNGVEVMIDLR